MRPLDVLPCLKPLALVVDIALGIDELELPLRADETSDLLGVVDPRDLDHDPLRSVSAGFGPNLGLVDADATATRPTRTARAVSMSVGQ